MKLTAEFKYAALRRWMRNEANACQRLVGNQPLGRPMLLGRACALRDALMKAKLLDKGQRQWR